jgi:hypothetical protein
MLRADLLLYAEDVALQQTLITFDSIGLKRRRARKCRGRAE